MDTIVTEKQCCKCKEVKNLDDFSFLMGGKYKRSAWCKKCHSKHAREWEKKHPERTKELYKNWATKYPERKITADHKAGRKYRLRTEYGITENDYLEMLENQKGLCAICGQDNKGKRLHIDHNHKTKKVRALLCGPCNHGLGLFKENINSLKKAIKYLEYHNELL